MSNVTITTDDSAKAITLSFFVSGQNGTTGFGNITIPKTLIPNGTSPVIYIDNKKASNQGFTQDQENYYVGYTTHFSVHQVAFVFSSQISSNPTMQWVIYAVASCVAAGAIAGCSLFIRKNKKHLYEKVYALQ